MGKLEVSWQQTTIKQTTTRRDQYRMTMTRCSYKEARLFFSKCKSGNQSDNKKQDFGQAKSLLKRQIQLRSSSQSFWSGFQGKPVLCVLSNRENLSRLSDASGRYLSSSVMMMCQESMSFADWHRGTGTGGWELRLVYRQPAFSPYQCLHGPQQNHSSIFLHSVVRMKIVAQSVRVSYLVINEFRHHGFWWTLWLILWPLFSIPFVSTSWEQDGCSDRHVSVLLDKTCLRQSIGLVFGAIRRHVLLNSTLTLRSL
jgi:hypothetical protein